MKILADFTKNPASSVFTIIAVEIFSIVLMSLGLVPRELSIFLLGILLFFIISSELKNALRLTIFSIPLYTTLVITESFDSMSSWRIIVLALFTKSLFVWIFRGEVSRDFVVIASRLLNLIIGLFKNRLGILVFSFFLLAFASLFVAEEPIFGLKKIIYLLNIFALFFVVKMSIHSRQDWLNILKYAFAGSILTLFIGYGQFALTLFVPLYNFWQWWASHVIPVFYGSNLGDLLSYSNTWFSYYEDAEPTLRIFSILPDSHSFALFMLLSMPITLTFFVCEKRFGLAKLSLAFLAFGTLMSMILSGTRGVWIGAAPVFLCLVLSIIVGKFANKEIFQKIRISKILSLLRKFQKSAAIGIVSFLIFALLFPISSQVLRFAQGRHGGKVSDDTTLERVSSSLSKRELSNKGRVEIWESTFESIGKKPWLGVGIGNYPVVLGENISATKEGASAHSLYLDVIAEMGIFAGIILFLIFIEILWRSITVSIASKDTFFALFAGFFAVYLLWVMSYSIVDVVLLNDKVLLFFTVLVGLIYSISNIKDQKSK